MWVLKTGQLFTPGPRSPCWPASRLFLPNVHLHYTMLSKICPGGQHSLALYAGLSIIKDDEVRKLCCRHASRSPKPL